MAKYSVVNGRYKDGNKFVAGDDVPEVVKDRLKDSPDGTILDELGEPFDPTTDLDDSEDETPPTPDDNDKPDDDESDDDDADDDAEYQDPNNRPVPQDEEGMGWPRSKGKTLSIFSKKPHETVKSVAGHLVPMTHEEYETKTDAEIIKKLKSLKKI